MKNTTLLLFLFLSFQAFSQHRIYYNNRFVQVDSTDDYLFYEEILDISPDSSYVKHFNNKGILEREGAFAGFGTKIVKPLGTHRRYYTADAVLQATITYVDGKESEIRSYYPSGKLKRAQTSDDKGNPTGTCCGEDGSPRTFTAFEQQPQFPGGERALMGYLAENIVYPSKARKKNIQGTVIATFIVNKNGKISNVNILKGLEYGCSEEVMRILSAMPDWEPGMADDIPVKVRYTLPVKFKLE